MGLDMYLNRRREGNTAREVMYWRKANAIHKWFVDKVQGGEDDCKEYPVSSAQLIELRDTCKRVLDGSKLVPGQVVAGWTYRGGQKITNLEDGQVVEDASVAKELLPTQDGFFFGCTDYNEWYLDDVKKTYEGLAALNLEEPYEGEYTYQSSW